MGERPEMNVAALTVEELLAQAHHLLRRDHGERHWSIAAQVLLRIEGEQLYEAYGWPSLPAYAENELGLDRAECFRTLQLGRLIRAAGSGVSGEQWQALTPSKAGQVLRIQAVGGELSSWVQKALAAKTTADLRHQVDAVLGKEAWVTWKVRIPGTLVELVETAMALALPTATGDPESAPERAKDPAVAFRCLEVVMGAYVMGFKEGGDGGTAVPS